MRLYIAPFFLLLLFSCSENNSPRPTTSLGADAYFGFEADTSATIFAPDLISKSSQELNAVFSPDGNEFYYTLADPGRSFYTMLMYTKGKTGLWEGPSVAPFSGKYADADPYITSDGSKLYFISRRPIDESSSASKDFDIWMVNRAGNSWGEAIRLDTSINTTQNEFYVSAINNGSIFYSGQYEGGMGYGDIYEAIPDSEGYSIQNLGPAINSPTGEGDPYVSPDGNMIIFMSWGREDDMGRGDLYISFKKDGEWQPAKNLGPKINSSHFEYCPMMSPDGKYFFWTSYKVSPFESKNGYSYEEYVSRLESVDNGLGNIYWIDASILETFK